MRKRGNILPFEQLHRPNPKGNKTQILKNIPQTPKRAKGEAIMARTWSRTVLAPQLWAGKSSSYGI